MAQVNHGLSSYHNLLQGPSNHIFIHSRKFDTSHVYERTLWHLNGLNQKLLDSQEVVGFMVDKPHGSGGPSASFLYHQELNHVHLSQHSFRQQNDKHTSIAQDFSTLPKSKVQNDCLLTPQSIIHTMYQKYKVVISIDMSPSMLITDPISGDVLFDRAYEVLEDLCDALSKGVQIIGSYKVEHVVHLSVIAFGDVTRSVYPVVQDVVLNQENVVEMVTKIKTQLRQAETEAAMSFAHRKKSKIPTSDFNIVIQNSLAAFEFLPPDACPVLVLITDGVFSLTNLQTKVLTKLNESDTNVVVLNIAIKRKTDFPLCYIPNQELMNFVVRSNGGTLIDFSFFQNEEVMRDKEFGNPKKKEKILSLLNVKRSDLLQEILLLKHNWLIRPTIDPILERNSSKQSQHTYKLMHVDLKTLIRMRLKQGFRILHVKFLTHSDLDKVQPQKVSLQFWFRPGLIIEYEITSIDDGLDISIFFRSKKRNFLELYLKFLHKRKNPGPKFKLQMKLNEFIQKLYGMDRKLDTFTKHLTTDISTLNLKKYLDSHLFDIEKIGLLCTPTPTSEGTMDSPEFIKRIPSAREFLGSDWKELHEAADIAIIEILEKWKTVQKDALYIKLVKNTGINIKKLPIFESVEKEDTTGVCIITLNWVSFAIAEIKFHFFRVYEHQRKKIISTFKKKVEESIVPQVSLAFRGRSLIETFKKLPCNLQKIQDYSKMVSSQIPHFTSFMRHKKWLWPRNPRMQVADILKVLFAQRLKEGFQFIANSSEQHIMLKQLSFVNTDGKSQRCDLFYSAQLVNDFLITEYWLEALSGSMQVGDKFLSEIDVNHCIRDHFDRVDRDIISLFTTFSAISHGFESGSKVLRYNSDLESTISTFSLSKDVACIPLNIYSLWDRSEKHSITLPIFPKEMKSQNISLLERLTHVIEQINVKIPMIDFSDWEGISEEEKSYLMQCTCYAKVEGESKQNCLLTFVPQSIDDDAKDLVIRFGQINYKQLFSLHDFTHIANAACQEIFQINQSKPQSKCMPNPHKFSCSRFDGNFIETIHAQLYSYGVFKHLQKKSLVDDAILNQAIRNCYEYALELDLTELLESILLSKNFIYESVADYDSPYDEMNKYFMYLIKKHFSQCVDHFVMREKPDESASTILSASNLCLNEFEDIGVEDAPDENSLENPDDIIMKKSEFFSETGSVGSFSYSNEPYHQCYSNLPPLPIPVFMRMECEIVKPHRGIESPSDQNSEFIDFDMMSESSSQSITDDVISFPVVDIPVEKITNSLLTTEDTSSWISSIGTTKITLKIVIITSRPDQMYLAENNYMSQNHDAIVHMYKNFDPDIYEMSRSHPTFNASEVEDDNEPYLDILHLPSNVKHLLERTKKKIQALISKQIINCLLVVSPLTKTNIDRVQKHLTKMPPQCHSSERKSLKFVDDELGPELFQQQWKSFNDSVKIRLVGKIYVMCLLRKESQPPSYYSWHTRNQVDSHLQNSDVVLAETPYWILFNMINASSINVTFYSPFPITRKQRKSVTEKVNDAISKTNRLVNQIILLENVNQTRVCSRLLIKEEDEDKLMDSFDRSNYDENTFSDEEFKCDEKYAEEIVLHQRLKPIHAKSKLSESIFFPIRISNRFATFIYRDQGENTFLIKIHSYIQNVEDSPDPDASMKQIRQLSPIGTILRQKCPKNSGISILRISVCGIAEPSEQITLKMMKSVRKKLDQLTLRSLGDILHNQPGSKLTLEDIEYLRPPSKTSDVCTKIPLPEMVSDHFVFLEMLRQNLEYLRILRMDGDETLHSFLSDDVHPLKFDPITHTYLYNHQTYELTMEGSSVIGNGIGIVHLTFLDTSGHIVTSFPEQKLEQYVKKFRFTVRKDAEEKIKVQYGILISDKDGNKVTFKVSTVDRLKANIENCNKNYWIDETKVEKGDCIEWEIRTSKSVLFLGIRGDEIESKVTSLKNSGNMLEQNVFLFDSQQIQDFLNAINVNISGMSLDEIRSPEKLMISEWSDVNPLLQTIDWTDVSKYPLPFSSGPINGGNILLEIWGKGDIHSTNLMNRIVKSINQTICDYFLEYQLLQYHPKEIHIENYIHSFLSLVNRSSKHESTISIKQSFETFMPDWIAKDFVVKVKMQLSDLSPDMKTFFFLDKKTNTRYIISGLFIHQALTKHGLSRFPILKLNDSTYSRNCAIVAVQSKNTVELVTHNLRLSIHEQLTEELARSVSFSKCRTLLLSSILHQKLGYFAHAKELESSGEREVKFSKENIDILIENKFSRHSFEKNPVKKDQSAVEIYARRFKRASNEIQSRKPLPRKQPDQKPFYLWLHGVFDPKDEISHSKHRKDPLEYHGSQFKKIITQNISSNIQRSRTSQIYIPFTKRGKKLDELTAPELMIIKNTSRLFHFCQAPILFNDIRHVLFDEKSLFVKNQLKFSPRSSLTQRERQNYNRHLDLLSSYLTLYTEYLQSTVGIKESKTCKFIESDNPTILEINGKLIKSSQRAIYFQKVMHGGVFLLELTFEPSFASVKLYVSDLYDERYQQKLFLGSMPKNAHESKRTNFLEKTSELKHMLHVNSFTYDFHVRILRDYIVSEDSTYPELNLVNILYDFVRYHIHIPKYSRNLIERKLMKKKVKLPKSAETDRFFSYIQSRASIFSPFREEIRKQNALIFEEDDSIVVVTLQDYEQSIPKENVPLYFNVYYILVSPENQALPEHNQEEIILMQGKIAKLEKFVEQNLDTLVDVSMLDFRLDCLWQQAIEFTISEEYFEQLTSLCARIKLSDIDPVMKEMETDEIPWFSILPVVQSQWDSNRCFGFPNHTNFIFLHDQENSIMIQCKIHPQTNELSVWFCKQIALSLSLSGEYELNKLECDFISQFVNSLLFSLWNTLLK